MGKGEKLIYDYTVEINNRKFCNRLSLMMSKLQAGMMKNFNNFKINRKNNKRMMVINMLMMLTSTEHQQKKNKNNKT